MDDMDEMETGALADDLEAFLAGDETEWPPGYTFTAEGDGHEAELDTAVLDDRANWTLRRIRRAQLELARIDRTAEAERARIRTWEQDRSAGPRRLIEAETANLEAIARRLVELNPKRKTINLPNGRVKLTAPGAASLVVDDEAALVAWLKANHPDVIEELVTVTEKWGKPDVKKLIKPAPMSDDEAAGADPEKVTAWAVDAETGERIPGVHLEAPAKDRFTFDL